MSIYYLAGFPVLQLAVSRFFLSLMGVATGATVTGRKIVRPAGSSAGSRKKKKTRNGNGNAMRNQPFSQTKSCHKRTMGGGGNNNFHFLLTNRLLSLPARSPRDVEADEEPGDVLVRSLETILQQFILSISHTKFEIYF